MRRSPEARFCKCPLDVLRRGLLSHVGHKSWRGDESGSGGRVRCRQSALEADCAGGRVRCRQC
eukprot:14319749-Alexandrium_andersonii.AAC.1